MLEIIKLTKDHKQLIWGTEDWVVSGHENGMSKVMAVGYEGMSVSEFIKQRPDIFNHQINEKLPLLIKIIDAKDDLSVQVHPGDNYAKKHEDSLGKTECWYILDADVGSDIIVGQNALDKAEMQAKINDQRVIDVLDVKEVKKGDFFYIPSGTVHAIRKNTKILEVQQSSDITYRLFDYNRVQQDGSLRELHINKALDVINFNQNNLDDIKREVMIGNSKVTSLVKSTFFDVTLIDLDHQLVVENEYDYILGVAIDEVIINGEKVLPGEGFIIPHKVDIKASGNGQFVISAVVRR